MGGVTVIRTVMLRLRIVIEAAIPGGGKTG
jgi:hypothetical protein